MFGQKEPKSVSSSFMKIALIGYGNMGQLLNALALAQGHEVVAIIDRSHDQATHTTLTTDAIARADVCIDFTHGDAVLDHAKQVIAAKKPLVIGTTGWDSQREALQQLVMSTNSSVVFGANFSIGVHLFYALVQDAAHLLRGFADYSVSGIEFHHSRKRDMPSGTALKLTEIIRSEMPSLDPKFAFSSVRSGHYPGTHALSFDSPCDTIELRHTARSRQGFAEGALMAAQWIQGRQGFHTVEEMILDISLDTHDIPKPIE